VTIKARSKYLKINKIRLRKERKENPQPQKVVKKVTPVKAYQKKEEKK
jgi:hypothetical protein